MKIIKLSTILSFVFCANFLIAQTELVIEVNTDINPDETSWVLYDLQNNVIASRSEFERSANHLDTVLLDNSSCYYWRIYDSYGEGLSAGDGGSFSLFVNAELFYASSETNFGDSASVYTIGQVCSNNDINVLNVDMLYYISKDMLDIKFVCLNQGSEAIESLEFTYSINGAVSESKIVSDLNIAVGEVASVAHPDQFDFDTPDIYTIDVNVTKVNGVQDSYTDNNFASKDVEVLDGYVLKNVFEDFSSFECPYCYDADLKLDETLHGYPGTYTFVKYMSWAFADRKFFNEIDTLMDFYNVGGLPHIMQNGSFINWNTFTPTFYYDYVGLTTSVKLTIEAYVEGDFIYSTVKVLSDIDLDENLILRGVIAENECYDVAVRFENSAPFFNVAYVMFPGYSGFDVGALTAGIEKEFTIAVPLSNLPLEDGSLEDLTALFYLQNGVERTIYQSEWEQLSYESVAVETSFNIEDNATDVDTAGLVIEFSSNRLLFDNEGDPIFDLTSYVTLKKDSFEGVDVPYNAILTEGGNGIHITQQYKWKSLTSYHVTIKPMFTVEGTLIPADSLSFTIKDYNGVGVNTSIINNNINIYPNPTNGVLNIDCSSQCVIQLMNLSGQILFTQDINPGTHVINLDQFEVGVYFVHLTDLKGLKETYKILKK